MNDRRKQIAKLTTYIVNPFLVSVGLITLLSFKSLPTASAAIKWSLILIGLNILPVFVVVIYLLRIQKLGSFFINARNERLKIYLLSGVCTIIGGSTLIILEAPPVLMAAYVAGFATTVVFMLINLLWKISVHTALIAAAATMLIVLFGVGGAIGAALVPPTAWSRVELRQHSPAQAVTGALLASAIVVVVFYFFGLVGHNGPA